MRKPPTIFTLTCLLTLLALAVPSSQVSTIDNLGCGTLQINTQTYYTWTLTLQSAVTSLNLTFPSSCSLSPTTYAVLSGTGTFASTSYQGSTFIITNTNLVGSITIIVYKVTNPNSAITTYSFSFATPSQTITLTQSNQLIYSPDTLNSAAWAFSLCTEQPSSTLTTTVTLNTPIPTGNNKFLIKYDSWANLASKHLLTDVSTPAQLSGNVTYKGVTATASFTIDFTKKIITVSYTQTLSLAQNDTLAVVVAGVNSPPTQVTPPSTYWVATADPTGAIFDQSSTLDIGTTCLYTLSSGVYSPSSPPIKSSSFGPTISFSQTPTITIDSGDTVEMYFTPLGNFVCSTLKIWRDISVTMQASNPVTTAYTAYTVGSLNTPNTQYALTITLQLSCSSVTITNSETPVDLTFKFKRNNTYYLQLATQMKPAAVLLPTSKTSLAASLYPVTYTNVTYTFTITTSYLLGPSPALALAPDPAISVPASPICSVSINSVPATAINCLFANSILALNFTSSTNTQIAAGSIITVTVQGLTNPSSPTTYNVGATTYFQSIDSSSRVEYNSKAFAITFTGISNYPMTFAPSSLQVYTSSVLTTITLTTNISLPQGCSIYVEYPSATAALAIAGTPLKINSATSSTSPGTNNLNYSYTVTTGPVINPNDQLTLQATITTPSILDTYNFVKVVISYNNTLYLSSTTAMSLVVDTLNSITPTLTPSPAKAGAPASYSIALPMTVPHPANFYLEVYLPSDITYVSAGSTCTGNCNSLVSSSNSSYFRVTVTNPNPSGTSQTLTLSLSSTFSNPRAVGNGMLWNLSTSTISPSNKITLSQAYPVITDPNSLTAQFLADSYYKGKAGPVKISFTFTNLPVASDTVQLQISTNTYYENSTNSVTCSAIFGTCSKNALSTPALLIVDIQPNTASFDNHTLSMVLEGVVSGTNVADAIPVKLTNGTGKLIEQGTLNYQVSCRDGTTSSILNNCKTCSANGSCLTCYTENGFYLDSTLVCVTDCGLATAYLAYSNNSTYTCQNCTNNCYTCTSPSLCITCLSTYYFYQHNASCLPTCDPNGYIQQAGTTQLICVQCYGAGLCLQCSSSVIGACQICASGTVLSAGQCLSNCTNSSMYPSGGICYPCDSSCSTCYAGTSAGCILCAPSYFNYSNYCVSACPAGTVSNLNNVCTCQSPCSKCQGSTTYCTACVNSSLFVSNGNCLSSCPGQTYLSGTTCVSCNTGCSSCSATTCYSCLSGTYLYNNLCYSDCNLISRQYDVSGSTCVLCPDGCDSCSGTTCTSCLSGYSLSSTSRQCINTCLLTNSCDYSGEPVLPLPGLISVVIWAAIVVGIKLLLHKNYLPYSLILCSAVVELVLAIAVVGSAPNLDLYVRLLLPSDSERQTIRALLGVYLATNYLSNLIYIVLFVKYIKPLLVNPRQIDTISNIVVIAVGTLTNYRFALLAFAKLFPKPSIYVPNSSKLTPVHYLCVATIVLDVLPIAACSMAIYNEQPKTNLFMLAVDLLIIVALNVIITLQFVGCAKADEYYDDDIKKYHLEDAHGTNETMPNEKNLSKAHMVPHDTYNFTEEDASSFKADALNASYNKLNLHQSKVSIQSIRDTKAGKHKHTDSSGEDSNIIPVKTRNQGSSNTDYDPFNDPNYEVGLKPKYSARQTQPKPTRDSARQANSKPTRDKDLPNAKSEDEGLDLKDRTSPQNYTKHKIVNDYINETPSKELEEVEEDYDLPDLEEESQHEGRKSVFELPKEKLARPRRTGTERKVKAQQALLNKSSEEPLKIMKKDKRIGYFQSDALESNEDDIESIIKQKVWQSSIKKQESKEGLEKKQFQSSNNSEVGNEEISPSWFNIQNQRIELSDFDEKESAHAEP